MSWSIPGNIYIHSLNNDGSWIWLFAVFIIFITLEPLIRQQFLDGVKHDMSHENDPRLEEIIIIAPWLFPTLHLKPEDECLQNRKSVVKSPAPWKKIKIFCSSFELFFKDLLWNLIAKKFPRSRFCLGWDAEGCF